MSDMINEINVRAGVTSLPDRCCINCVKLTTVILPAPLLSIEYYAFHGCKSLRNFVLPKSLSPIGRCCFWGSGLESIVIPNSVTTLGEEGLNGIQMYFLIARLWRRLSQTLVLPNSLSSIPTCTFYNCR